MEEDGAPPAPREDRGPRIPPAKLATIKPDPTISIFYKPIKSAPSQLLDGKFPRDAAMIFCDRIRHDLMDYNSKSFTITGGDLISHKETLAWIKECVTEQSIVKFKELDDSIPELFKSYANIIVTATYLGIPARDLGDGLLKRMHGIARKKLMKWDEVEWFYNSPALDTCSVALREVAAASVFWGWWTAKLDEDETPEDMMFLDVLRQEIPKLDHDLHEWCERNEQEVRKKWEEKKKAKEAEASGDTGDFSAGGGGGWDNVAPATTGGGDWDNAAAPAAAGGNDWENTAPATAAVGGWDNAALKGTAGGGWDTELPPSDGNKAFGFDSGIVLDDTAQAVDRKDENAFNSFNPPPGGYGAAAHDEFESAENGQGGDWADEVIDQDEQQIEHHSQSW
ncbi:hypothetical protein PV11_07079 [Exophiala sideris]|uniref:Uncharacterized protein n=1 Tax=Exophiala sideris TaxID=1016849 RepID=A0A0D1YXP2_9EURO|nr:hypothetical protein PV11_07079 [Exophiala sideris]